MGSSERALATGEKHAYRPLGNAEGGGNFAIAVPGVAEQQCRRLPIREDGEGSPHALTLVGAHNQVVRIAGKRWDLASGDELGAYVGAAAAPQSIQAAVGHDPGKPGGDVIVATLGHGIRAQGEQGVLGGVLSLVDSPEHPSGQAHKRQVVAAEHLCEAIVW